MEANPSILQTTKEFNDQRPKVRTMYLKPIQIPSVLIKPCEDFSHHQMELEH